MLRCYFMFSPQLVDVFLIHEDINLVFEFCETDLESILMEQSVILKPEHIKCHMRMLLDGLGYLHDNFVLHRVRALKLNLVVRTTSKTDPGAYISGCRLVCFSTRLPARLQSRRYSQDTPHDIFATWYTSNERTVWRMLQHTVFSFF